jgi:hypothetical protein
MQKMLRYYSLIKFVFHHVLRTTGDGRTESVCTRKHKNEISERCGLLHRVYAATALH